MKERISKNFIWDLFREYQLKSILFDQCSGYDYLIEQSNEHACFWGLRTLVHRCLSSNDKTINEL